METIGDLDLRVVQPFGQGSQRSSGDEVTALIAASSPAPIGAMTTSPRPSIALAVPLRAFGVM